jgi:hypothetical protein
MFQEAFNLARLPIVISFIITPVRFSLELIGLPELAIFLIGLLWFTMAFSIYFGFKQFDNKNPYHLLLLTLIIFSPISRIPVFLLWWIDTTWEIGTHYNIFTSWGQALVGQLFYGSFVQIIPGFIMGSLVLIIMRSRSKSNMRVESK